MTISLKGKPGQQFLAGVSLLMFMQNGIAEDRRANAGIEAYQRADQGEVFGSQSNGVSCGQQGGRNCAPTGFGNLNVPAASAGLSEAAFAANRARRRQSFQEMSDENQRAAELRQREMAERAERERLAAQNTQTGSGFADIFSAVAGAYAQQLQAEPGAGQATHFVQQPQANAVQAAPSYGVVAPVPEPPRAVQPAPPKPVVGTIIKNPSIGAERIPTEPAPPPKGVSGGIRCPTGYHC